MFIHGMEIENFKGIKYVDFKSDGKHIVLSGINGTGKSSVVELITTAFLGKKLLPDDPVLHGQESSKNTIDIGDGEKLIYTLKVNVKNDDISVKIYTYDENGNKSKRALNIAEKTFLSGLMFSDALDPMSFFNKSDRDQLNSLYKILPDLQKTIDSIDSEKTEVQAQRSIVNSEKETAEHKLEELEYISGLPETEVDPADLMKQISDAQQYNKGKDNIVRQMNDLSTKIETLEERENTGIISKNYLEEEIQRLQNKLEAVNKRLSEIKSEKAGIESDKENLQKHLDSFKEKDTSEIENQIENINETNRKIRTNKEYKELEKTIEQKREEFSAGLVKMKELDQKKADAMKSAKMPIDGLSVGDGCLMFPDPNSGELVRLNSLSTGQKWRVVVSILAAFLPDPEKGMRVMVVNVSDLDKENYTAMLKAAKENNVQYIMHKTVFESEKPGLEIIVEEK